jgi:hypothetical protein
MHGNNFSKLAPVCLVSKVKLHRHLKHLRQYQLNKFRTLHICTYICTLVSFFCRPNLEMNIAVHSVTEQNLPHLVATIIGIEQKH